MARYTCPSCGAAYNGKKCRSCLYENFGDGKLREDRTRKGSPLVVDAPASGKTGDNAPVFRPQKTRGKNPMVRFVLLLAVINSLMPLIRNWGLDLKARERASTVRQVAVRAEPEPVMAPEEIVFLHQEQDISIFANLEDFTDFRDGLCLYVEYTGDLPHVTVVMGDIKVNGCDMPLSTLVCKARSGEIGKGWLELDEQDLKEVSIETAEILDFTLTALGSNGRLLFTTDAFQLVAEDGV